ncbi:HET-domain-containing protein [Stipitochalara longipes BDJ]|nr:HET-domain-containing protein [Stipitochalara longipes BDJ]
MSQEGGSQASTVNLPAEDVSMEEGFPSQLTPEPLYRPLLNSEIRLIRLKSGGWCDPIVCDLISVRLDDKPKFVALSYAWGDPTDTRPITLNSQTYNITVNLFQGLRRLRHMVSEFDHNPESFITERLENFYIWADAICINQGDEHEKAYQIVRMRNVYTSAYRVCAWIGENAHYENTIIHRVIGMTHSLYSDTEVWEPYFNELFERSCVDLKRCAEGILKLTARSWFSRVWVIQEVALAVKWPVILAGGAWTHMNALFILARIVNDCRSGFVGCGRIARKWGTIAPLFCLVGIRLEKNDDEASNMDASALGSRLDKILAFSHGYFKATLPHDYIYGLLGLVSSGELPDPLQPDYNKPLGQVCQEYTRLIIENTGNLSSAFRFRTSLEGFPSWVPDFGAKCTTVWQKPSINVSSSISFSHSGDQITLLGLEYGTCLHVYTPPSYDLDDLRANCSTWLQQLDIFLRKASDITHLTRDETLERWLQLKQSCNRTPLSISEMEKLYKPMIRDKAQVDWYEQSSEFRAFFKKTLYSFSTLVTQNGSLATLNRYDRLAEIGDVLVVVREPPRVILLRSNKENGVYTFLGQCDCLKAIHSQELFSNNVLKEFIIV